MRTELGCLPGGQLRRCPRDAPAGSVWPRGARVRALFTAHSAPPPELLVSHASVTRLPPRAVDHAVHLPAHGPQRGPPDFNKTARHRHGARRAAQEPPALRAHNTGRLGRLPRRAGAQARGDGAAADQPEARARAAAAASSSAAASLEVVPLRRRHEWQALLARRSFWRDDVGRACDTTATAAASAAASPTKLAALRRRRKWQALLARRSFWRDDLGRARDATAAAASPKRALGRVV